MADCSAFNNLPLIGMATKAAFGEDLLLAAGVDYKPYIKLVAQRPSAQRVVEDRKVAQAQGLAVSGRAAPRVLQRAGAGIVARCRRTSE